MPPRYVPSRTNSPQGRHAPLPPGSIPPAHPSNVIGSSPKSRKQRPSGTGPNGPGGRQSRGAEDDDDDEGSESGQQVRVLKAKEVEIGRAGGSLGKRKRDDDDDALEVVAAGEAWVALQRGSLEYRKEVWHRRMPSHLPFGETPAMEAHMSRQIDADLERGLEDVKARRRQGGAVGAGRGQQHDFVHLDPSDEDFVPVKEEYVCMRAGHTTPSHRRPSSAHSRPGTREGPNSDWRTHQQPSHRPADARPGMGPDPSCERLGSPTRKNSRGQLVHTARPIDGAQMPTAEDDDKDHDEAQTWCLDGNDDDDDSPPAASAVSTVDTWASTESGGGGTRYPTLLFESGDCIWRPRDNCPLPNDHPYHYRDCGRRNHSRPPSFHAYYSPPDSANPDRGNGTNPLHPHRTPPPDDVPLDFFAPAHEDDLDSPTLPRSEQRRI